MAKSHSIFEIDLYVALATVGLVIIGILFIFSSGVTADGEIVSREYVRQIVFGSTGLVWMLLVTFVDYRSIQRPAYIFYGVVIVLLIITALFGRVVNGARSWIGIGIGNIGIQPSEFAKLALIIALSRYFADNPQRGSSLVGFGGGLLLMVLPMALVLAQPDLGSSLVYIPIFLMIAFAAGADARFLGFFMGTGILVALFAVLPVWEENLAHTSVPFLNVLTERGPMGFLLLGLSVAGVLSGVGYYVTRLSSFFWILYGIVMLVAAIPVAYVARSVLQEYQIMRLIVFIDPYVDPRGAGWNIIQSVTAVGSGGPFGKGFLEGTQSHYQYLPQQSTDFIFSILAEEWGFAGVLVVFGLFGVILGRGVYIMASARDRFAALLVAGVMGMLLFHIIVNIGMAVGIMPITGIPLFLVSYGGSSLWTAMVAIGLIMSVYQHRYQY